MKIRSEYPYHLLLTLIGLLALNTLNAQQKAINANGAKVDLNYVDKSSDESINGKKTFTSDLAAHGLTIGLGGSGLENTAFGVNALVTNTSGTLNTAVGEGALYLNTAGAQNTAIGEGALYANSVGVNNSAFGQNALHNNVSGQDNIAIGNNALSQNATGVGMIAIGYGADVGADGQTNGTAIGTGAVVSASNAAAIGAGAVVSASNTIQLGNGYVTDVKTNGTLTLGNVNYPNTHNSTEGQVLVVDADGVASWRTTVGGGSADFVDLSNDQTVAGNKIFSSDLTVNGLTIGQGAVGPTMDNSYPNTAVGVSALASNVSGITTTAIGNRSLEISTEGLDNTAVGSQSLSMLTSGSYNTSIGTFTMNSASGGDYNTAIGAGADVMSPSGSPISNATAIGAEAIVDASNTIQLGNPDVTDVKTYGFLNTFGINLLSDARLKRNVIPLSSTIEGVLKLNPVSYEKKSSLNSSDYRIKENGFIAQELRTVYPDLINEGSGPDKLLSVNYISLIPVLTKAIQEQQAQISSQQSQIDELKKMVELLINKK